MVKRFKLKNLFDDEDCAYLQQNFGLKRMNAETLCVAIKDALKDYVILGLSELGDEREEKNRIYLEARFHMDKAKKLLEAMPHPAGKMSQRLETMCGTLDKLVDEDEHPSSKRAARFMEKNLARKLRDIWQINTSTPFHAGSDGSGKNPRDYLLFCFRKAGAQYPEIRWFNHVDASLADTLIKSVRRE